ncbi:MAG: hypothetical protein ABT940_06895 [Alphaproteobacteria bacterium]
MSYEAVEAAWALADAAHEKQTGQGTVLSLAEWWQQFFSGSDQVDKERSLREGGNPPARIFLNSPYGLQYREEHKDWIPFRHGDVKID